jgi:hypothetical protein
MSFSSLERRWRVWTVSYNQMRPHSALGYPAPARLLANLHGNGFRQERIS